jgi:hypothetical protein
MNGVNWECAKKRKHGEQIQKSGQENSKEEAILETYVNNTKMNFEKLWCQDVDSFRLSSDGLLWTQ